MSKISLVVGGAGALGSKVVETFLRNGIWTTGVLDYKPGMKDAQSFHADKQLSSLIEDIKAWNGKLDAVVHVAGGFQAGSIMDGEEPLNRMWEMNAKSAFTAAYIASHILNEKGIFILTGAQAAFGDNSVAFATGYGMSKAATHQLARDFHANMKDSTKDTICMLPSVIDTPANRISMPDADFSSWSTPEKIASKVVEWASDSSARPKDLFVKV